MTVKEELSALRVTEVRTPRPDGSIHEDEMVAAHPGDVIIMEPPTLRVCARVIEGAVIGLLMIEVPGRSMSSIERRINLEELVVRPVSMIVMK